MSVVPRRTYARGRPTIGFISTLGQIRKHKTLKMKRSNSALRRLRQLDENSKRTKMSQPGITQFTRRVTRRQTAAQQKQTLLDRDNSNIISLSDKTTKLVPISPRKSESKPLHITSPAKIRKTSETKEKPKRGRKKEPSPAPRTRKGETIQAAFQRQLDVLKSPTKVILSELKLLIHEKFMYIEKIECQEMTVRPTNAGQVIASLQYLLLGP